MKFRSTVLLACMAIVPLVAMFSHKIPRDWRLRAWRLAGGHWAHAEPEHSPAEAPAEAPGGSAQAVADPPLVPATRAIGDAPEAMRQTGAITPRATISASNGNDEPASVEDQLRALGATAVECVTLAGGTMHRCSCRVAAEPSGQLQRVFQTSNPDPAVALRNLLGQVHFWKHRTASRDRTGTRGRAPGGAMSSGAVETQLR